MNNVYKVNAAKIEKTKNGFDLYRLDLNDSIFATKRVPRRGIDQRFDKLYKLSALHNGTLDFLTGKYIAIDLTEGPYGLEFHSIISPDVLQEIKLELDKSGVKAFYTRIDLFNFLRLKGRPLNSDGSITLREPYNNFNIQHKNGGTFCYANNLLPDTITPANIEAIYNKFYEGVYIDTGNPDRDSQYELTSAGIVK